MTLRYFPFICVLVSWVQAEISTMDYVPEVQSREFIGRLTSTTLLLKEPQCCFSHQLPPSCAVSLCEIWLVVASAPGVVTFDTEKLSPDVLSSSPYPSAFIGEKPRGFYITRLGPLWDYPCSPLPRRKHFRVGDDGNCTAVNCNGILPPGSTVRVKYILTDPKTAGLVSESKWSNPIALVTPMPNSIIDEGLKERSAEMVVITVVTSCLMAALLLLLVGLLIVDRSGVMREKNIPVTLKTYKNFFGQAIRENHLEQEKTWTS